MVWTISRSSACCGPCPGGKSCYGSSQSPDVQLDTASSPPADNPANPVRHPGPNRRTPGSVLEHPDSGKYSRYNCATIHWRNCFPNAPSRYSQGHCHFCWPSRIRPCRTSLLRSPTTSNRRSPDAGRNLRSPDLPRPGHHRPQLPACDGTSSRRLYNAAAGVPGPRWWHCCDLWNLSRTTRRRPS